MATRNHRWKLSIDRAHLGRAKIVHESKGAPDLAAGEVELRLRRFAMTANNVTYAILGESFVGATGGGGYWDFFPGDSGEGLLPVWGLADVVRSTVQGLDTGIRVYGMFPLASHVRMAPQALRSASFIDGAPHRLELPAVYQQYTLMAETSLDQQDLWAVFRPLLTTGFVLADLLAQESSTRRIVVASASSKTALMLAHSLRCLDTAKNLIGLTSAGNLSFVRSTGLYDDVRLYDDLESLELEVETAYVDIAGTGAVTTAVHAHLGEALLSSTLVGKSHWNVALAGKGLAGPVPQPFFAPAQIEQRIRDWGRSGFSQRLERVWTTAAERMQGLLDIVHGSGPDSALETYTSLLQGNVPARRAPVITLD